MPDSRMSKSDRETWKAERRRAEKFICEKCKLGPLEYTDDGSNVLEVKFKWADLVKVVASYGVRRLVDAYDEQEKSAENPDA